MIIYLAGPKFSLAERTFYAAFAQLLERHLCSSDLVLQQNQAASPEAVGSAERPVDFLRRICKESMDHIHQCDAVVALLDGDDADAGTCVELGYAKGKGKLIVGVRTDCRQCEDRGLNLMVSNICSHLVIKPSSFVTIDELAEEVVSYLRATLRFQAAPAAGSLA